MQLFSYNVEHMTQWKEYGNVKTAFRHVGSGQDVILLHGWGQNMEMMGQIEQHLQSRFSVYTLDFPGHGESDEPPVSWSVLDYLAFLEDFIQQNDIHNPILIAHSFGGRVAIRYAAKHPDNVLKMVLTGSAGIKPKQALSTKLKVKGYKLGKWFLQKTGNEEALLKYQNRHGSSDYRNASGVMRETLVKVVNDDVTSILKDVKCPVLLVWGDKDEAVPIADAITMRNEMQDAGLAIFENDDHFAYWHQPERFNRVLDFFLLEDSK